MIWPQPLPAVSENRVFAWVLGWAGYYADPPSRIPPACTHCRYFSPGKYSDDYRRTVCIRRGVEAGRSPEQIRFWLIAAPYCVKQRAHGWLLARVCDECGREGRFWSPR